MELKYGYLKVIMKKEQQVLILLYFGLAYILLRDFWSIFSNRINRISLAWFMCLLSFVFIFSNEVGYYKCFEEQKKKITNFLAEKSQQRFSTILNLELML